LRLLRTLAVAASLLAGCGSGEPRYQGIDLTGVDWGRGFALRDPDGRLRTLEEFRGKYVLLFFGFTQCPDICPTALSRAAAVRRALGADGERLQVVFVTVDPERDTPALLREYMQAFDASFVGLRGDEGATRRTAKEFHVHYEKVPAGSSYTVNHTALTYVLDTQGRLRLGLRHGMSVDDFVSDLRILMRLQA